MVELDPRSVAYSAAIVGLFLLALNAVYWWLRQTHPGFGQWVLSLGMLVLALTGISWAQFFPAWLSEALINTSSILAMYLAASGAHQFLRHRTLDLMTTAGFGFGLSMVLLVQVTGPDLVRAGLGGLVMGLLALRAAYIFLWPRVKGLRLGSGFCGLLMLSMAVERFWRASFFVGETLSGPFMNPHHAAIINHSFNATFIALWAMAFVFLNASRVELDLRRSRTELQQLADRDPLTGLLNRRAFFQRAESEVEIARRASSDLSLLIIDMDHFKRVNDKFGHLAGDQVLIDLSQIVLDVQASGDSVARLGGEEFAFLLVGTGVDAATQLAKDINGRIRDKLVLSSGTYQVTASIGVGQLNENDATFEHLFARVDLAMYQAKRSGRDRVSVALNQKQDAMLTEDRFPGPI